jgi:transcriptional regulator with XRE-family HTH domain
MNLMEHTEGVDRERELPVDTREGDIPADTFAARLLLARHHAGRLSQREAAEKCGLNYASWSNWEDGRRPRDLLEVVDQISAGLRINREWLLFGGPLLPARGRPIRKASDITGAYPRPSVRPIDSRPTGRTRTRTATQPARRHRLIDRSQPVAV